MSKFRSFASTISLHNQDVSGDVKEYITKWLESKEGAFGVLEADKSGKLHAHFQIWLSEATTKDSAFKRFNAQIKKHSPSSDLNVAVKHVIAYNDDYYNKYCKKDIVETLIDNVPDGHADGLMTFDEHGNPEVLFPENPRSSYYPTEAEQSRAKKKSKCSDFYFNNLDCLLDEHYPDIKLNKVYPIITHKEIATALYELMFDKKLIAVIVDDKRRRNVAKCLFHYRFPHYSPEFCMTSEEYESYRTFSKICN